MEVLAKSRKSVRSKDTADKSAEEAKIEETTAAGNTGDESLGDGSADIAPEPVDTRTDQTVVGDADVDETSDVDTSDAATADDASLAASDDISDTDVTDSTSDVKPEGEQGDDSLLSEPAETDADVLDASSSSTETELDQALSVDETLETEPTDTENVADSSGSETPVPTPQPEVVQKSSGMWPAIFGGIVAALLGFIAGRGDQLDAYLPASMQRQAVDLSAIEAEAAELVAADEALQSRVAALENAEPPAEPESLSQLAEATTALQTNLSELEETVSSLTDRIAALEATPVPELPTDNATTDDVAALQSALDAQRAEIEALAERAAEAEAKAASEASKILARAALARVLTAVETGETFSPALGDLEDVTPVDVPEPLRTAAENGVPRLSDLQSSFPDAARTALSAIRSETPEADVQGISGFLRRTLGARSVTPREGDDPDAVLSRAEAAVRTGDLGAALDELQGLPEAGKDAMRDWLDAAAARKNAQDAARALSDSLNN